MPTVPVYGQRRVSRTPLPGVQQNPNAPPDAFGGPTPVNLSGATDQLGQIVLEEKRKADQVAVNAAERQLSDLRTQLLTDATSRRGVDALGASQDVTAQWQKGVAQIQGTLTSDAQRQSFATREAGYWANLHEAVETHAAAEFRRQDAEDTDALLQTGADSVLHNPSTAETAAGFAAARVRDFGKRNGWSEAESAQKVAEQQSLIHANAINAYIAHDQFDAAAAHFQQYGSLIQGRAYTTIEAAVQEGSARAKARKVADVILFGDKTGQPNAPGPVSTLSDGLERARMIQDPTERAAVENHIRQHFEDVATAERQERVEAYTKAGQIVEQSGDLYKVPLVIRQKLSPDELTTLAHQADRIRHPKTDTNPDLFYSLLNLTALNDLTRADFAARDLSKDRPNLSDEHYEFLLKRQIAIRTEMLNARAAEAKRQSDQAGKASASDARIEALIEQTDPAKRAGVAAIFRSQMSPALQQKYNLNAPVPGAPIVRTPPNEQRPSRPAPDAPPNWTVRVPQALLDRAARDPEYKLYLQHMGVRVP